MKTIQPRKITRQWHLVDAKDQVLGRISTQIAHILMGKHKVNYAPQADMGDNVVVINCEKVRVTGNKASQKKYYSHSGYPGGFKEVSYERMLKEHPERIVGLAVKRMLPENRLRDKRMTRLFVLVGERNPYQDKFKQKEATK
ncbi:MAG TPA: 50S ribosomal protein L13 [Patescibacteria group bacterium]